MPGDAATKALATVQQAKSQKYVCTEADGGLMQHSNVYDVTMHQTSTYPVLYKISRSVWSASTAMRNLKCSSVQYGKGHGRNPVVPNAATRQVRGSYWPTIVDSSTLQPHVCRVELQTMLKRKSAVQHLCIYINPALLVGGVC